MEEQDKNEMRHSVYIRVTFEEALNGVFTIMSHAKDLSVSSASNFARCFTSFNMTRHVLDNIYVITYPFTNSIFAARS